MGGGGIDDLAKRGLKVSPPGDDHNEFLFLLATVVFRLFDSSIIIANDFDIRIGNSPHPTSPLFSRDASFEPSEEEKGSADLGKGC